MTLYAYQKICLSAVLATTLGLTACGGDKNEPAQTQSQTAAATPETKPDTVKPLTDNIPAKEGLLRVSTTGEQPPFSFKDERGNLQGIDIDIIRAVGAAEGLEVVFFTEPWFEVFPSVVAGRRDIAVSGVSYNDERNANYTLSKPYLFVPSAIMVMEDSGINSVSDLAGKKFTCMKAAKQCGDIARLSPSTTVEEVASTFVSFQHLARRETFAIGEDLHLLRYFAKNHPGQKVKIIPYETENDPPANQVMMMAKGNTALVAKINSGIAKLKASGEIERIEKKWMQ